LTSHDAEASIPAAGASAREKEPTMRRKEITRRELKRELITRELLNGRNWVDPMCGPMNIPGDKK
jgi:hypothetical protein